MHGARWAVSAGILASFAAALWSPSPRLERTDPEPVAPTGAGLVRSLLRTPPRIEAAQDLLIARCMRRRGYRYPVRTTGRWSGDGYWIAALDQLTVTEASRHGYGAALGRPSEGSRLRARRQERYLSRLSRPARQGYFAALHGGPQSAEVALHITQGTFSVPLAGCVSHAKRRLFGTLRNYLLATYLPQEILLRQDAAWRDVHVRRSLSAYVRCMAEAGYPQLTRPDLTRAAAARMFGARPEDAPPTKRERSLALADARCQELSDIVPVFARALTRAAGGWFQIHERDVARIVLIQRRALARAREILLGPVRQRAPQRHR